jgi:hypothetical protein
MQKTIRSARRGRVLIMGGLALLMAAAIALPSGLGGGHGVTAAPLGGPVILGGDDLTDHGGTDGSNNNLVGWLYMQRALENIKPNVQRSNDGSIAALGSSDPGPVLPNSFSDAGMAIKSAADKVGLTVTYYDGGAAINGFFDDLEAGNTHPAIIWIAGNGAFNNLDSDEPQALADNAAGISAFVDSGGGLFSHGTNYEWLQALLPDATTVDGGSSDDLYFTDQGLDDLPALTEGDINAGPWHNHFEGDLGGLAVLVRSSSVQDSTGQDAAVIIGGAQVSITEDLDGEPTATATPCIPPLIGYRCDGKPNSGGGGGGSEPTAVPTQAPPQQPTAVSTVAGATVVPPAQPSGQPSGVITAPDTGTGDGTTGSTGTAAWLFVMAAAGVVLTLAGGFAVRRK